MKTGFWRNLLGNFWLLFAALGIALTLYASFNLIPQHLRGKNEQMANQMNRRLINQVQQRLIEGKKTHVIQLQTLIEGESLQHNLKYPYTVDELLIQTEADMLQNQFVPDSIKNHLSEKIAQIREEWQRYVDGLPEDYKASLETSHWQKYSSGVHLKIILVNVGGVILALIGFYSIYNQFLSRHHEFLKRLFHENQMAMEEQIKVNLWYEQILEKALTGLRMKYKVLLNKHSKADLHLKTESGQQVFIKSRYHTGKEDTHQEFIERFIHTVKVNKAYGVFVTNRDDKAITKILDQHNHQNPNHKIFMMVGDTVDELKAMIMNTVNRIDKKEN